MARFTFSVFRAEFRIVNRQVRFVLLASAVLHLWIGLFELLTEPASPYHFASAWQLLFRHVPQAVWDVAWLVVGVLALLGLCSVPLARLAFYASAGLFAVWGGFSFWSWHEGLGATLGASLQLGYLALLQVGIAEYVLRAERIRQGTRALADKVAEVRGDDPLRGGGGAD